LLSARCCYGSREGQGSHPQSKTLRCSYRARLGFSGRPGDRIGGRFVCQPGDGQRHLRLPVANRGAVPDRPLCHDQRGHRRGRRRLHGPCRARHLWVRDACRRWPEPEGVGPRPGQHDHRRGWRHRRPHHRSLRHDPGLHDPRGQHRGTSDRSGTYHWQRL